MNFAMKQIIFDVYKNAVEIRKISSHYAVVERRKKIVKIWPTFSRKVKKKKRIHACYEFLMFFNSIQFNSFHSISLIFNFCCSFLDI